MITIKGNNASLQHFVETFFYFFRSDEEDLDEEVCSKILKFNTPWANAFLTNKQMADIIGAHLHVLTGYAIDRRHSGLMVSALVPGLSGPGLSPSQGNWVVFLGKTLNSHIASLQPGV